MSKDNNFNVYIGIVVEDRTDTSRVLKVYCPELLPYYSGEIKDTTTTETFNIRDELNEIDASSDVKTTNAFTAEWFGDTNRVFPPNMVKGEQVLLLRYQDNDIYYWLPIGRDDILRRFETHRVAIANIATEGVKLLDDGNTYFIELDTRNKKRVRICTSKSDGESFRYQIMIDADNDLITIEDDAGNDIVLRSNIPQIVMTNNKGTTVDLNAVDILLSAPNNVTINAGNKINVTSKSTTTISPSNLIINSDTTVNGNTTVNGVINSDGMVSPDRKSVV